MSEQNNFLSHDIRKQAKYIIETGKLIHQSIVHEKFPQIPDGKYANAKKAKKIYDLSIAQMHTIQVIHECKKLNITKLAKALKVSSPSTSVMVDKLVEKEILTRSQDPDDRRKVVIQIANDFEEIMEYIEEQILSSFITLLQEIGPDTRTHWCEILTKVKEIIIDRQNPCEDL